MLKGDIDLTEDMIFYNEKKQGDFKLPAVFNNHKLFKNNKPKETTTYNINVHGTNSWSSTFSSSTMYYTYNTNSTSTWNRIDPLSFTNSEAVINYLTYHDSLLEISDDSNLDSHLDSLRYSYPEYKKYVEGKWDSCDDNKVSCLPPARPVHKMYDDDVDDDNKITINVDNLNSNTFGINVKYVLDNYYNNYYNWSNYYSVSDNCCDLSSISIKSKEHHFIKLFGTPKNNDMKYISMYTCSGCGRKILKLKNGCRECELCTHKNAIKEEMRRVLTLFYRKKYNEMESICYDGLGLEDYVSDYTHTAHRHHYRSIKYDHSRYIKTPWLEYMNDSRYKTYIEDITYDLKYPDGGEEEGGNATRYLTDRHWLRLPS